MRKIAAQIAWSLLYAVIGGLIFILGLNLLNWIPAGLQDVYKIGLPVLLLLAYLAAWKYLPAQKTIFLAFFLVSLSWALDFYLTGWIKSLFNLDTSEASGLAFTMVISTLVVSAPVIIGWLLSGRSLPDLFLQGSKKIWGILVGIAGLLLFGGLGVLQAWSEGTAMDMIAAALPFALIFALANAFREELVYRAAFIKGFQVNIGTLATVIVTTVVFTLAHVDVSYTPANMIIFGIVLLLIGVVGCWIMMKTGSLIGAVLFHAGADVLLILGMVASQQLTL